MPLIRESFPVGLLGCTCTIVADPETRQALVVDPGDQAPEILARLDKLGVQAVKLVHTHAHFDHVLATGAVAARTGAEILLHHADRWLYDNVELQVRAFGVPWSPSPMTPPTRELSGDEVLAFGNREARVLHTPGHTPGSICFFVERAGETPVLFSGDTLFRRSIGRTDLWGGSSEQLLSSIRERLFSLPDETVVVPGHGSPTTIGVERESNPHVGIGAGARAARAGVPRA
jgi:glyoxylase-like metal-dependent hydrolase (beta-lactamase superfamily II)